MTDRREKASRMVRFTSTDADQRLLSAIDRALETQVNGTFSDLCKQALQHYLFSIEPPVSIEPPANPGWILLQQQMIALQLQLTALTQQRSTPEPTAAIEKQIQILNDRLAQVEQQLENPLSTNATRVEADPLLSRLAPLLEDF